MICCCFLFIYLFFKISAVSYFYLFIF